MKNIKIEWKHFDVKGETCVRCSDTGKSVKETIKEIISAYQSKKIEIEFIETLLNADCLAESNLILINDTPLEKILNASKIETDCSSCCSMIGKQVKCRAIEYDGKIYEHLTAEIIKKGIIETINKKLQVLFLCAANSCRSQMAEGIANHFFGEILNAYNAGTNPDLVNVNAIKSMECIGIDISQKRSKHLSEFEEKQFDFIITLCGNTNDNCPYFPGSAQRLRWGFDDPAKTNGTSEEINLAFDKVRDEIKRKIIEFFGGIKNEN